MSPYAEGTSVSPERSQAEISEILRRYGADGFAYGWEADRAMIAFTAHGRQVRFVLPLPSKTDPAFARSPAGRTRDAKAAFAAYEAEHRRRWRALTLAIKAKLEVVDSGIATFETEFLANIVLPDGTLVGDSVLPAVEESYATGQMRPLLQIEASR